MGLLQCVMCAMMCVEAAPSIGMRLECAHAQVLAGGFMEMQLILVNESADRVSVGIAGAAGLQIGFQCKESGQAHDIQSPGMPDVWWNRHFNVELEPLQEASFLVLVNNWCRIPSMPGDYEMHVKCDMISPTIVYFDTDPNDISKWSLTASASITVQEASPGEFERIYAQVWERLGPILEQENFREEVVATSLFCTLLNEVGKVIYANNSGATMYKRNLLQSGKLNHDMVFDLFHTLTLRPSDEGVALVRDVLCGAVSGVDAYVMNIAERCARRLVDIGGHEVHDMLRPYIPIEVAPLAAEEPPTFFQQMERMSRTAYECPVPVVRPSTSRLD